MDAITVLAQLVHANLYPMALLLLVLALFTVRRKDALFTLFVSLAVLFFLLPAVKDFYGVPRACAGIAGCPADSAFPSGHAAVAFVFVAASIGLPVNFFFLAFAAFVAWSRLFLGVHTLDQVVAGAALAFMVFFIADWLVAHLKERFGIKHLGEVIPGGVGA